MVSIPSATVIRAGQVVRHARSGVLAMLASTAVLMGAACATLPTASEAGLRGGPARATDSELSDYGRFLAGTAALAKGEPDQASRFLQNINPSQLNEQDSRHVRNRAFLAAVLAGDTRSAAGLAPQDQDQSPELWRMGQLVLAVDLLAEGRGREAHAILGKPPEGYGQVFRLLQPWAAAEAGLWDQALSPPESDGDALVDYFGGLTSALLLEHRRQPQKAEELYQKLRARPAIADAFVLDYGAFLERRDRRVEAIELYTATLGRIPQDLALTTALDRAKAGRKAPPLPRYQEGAARMLLTATARLLAEQQDDTAYVFVRLASRLDPHSADVWLKLGDLERDQGDLDSALAAYERIPAAAPQALLAQGRTAWIYQSRDKTAEAIAYARRTLVQYPVQSEAMINLADLLRANKAYAESATILTRVIEMQASQADWRLLFMRGMAFEQAGDWPAAEADLLSALQKAPDEPQLLNYLGYSWIDRGEKLEQGLAMVQKAVSLNPRSGAMVDSLGWAYFRLGQFEEAVRFLELAAQMMPGDPEINSHLGDAYWRAGRKLEAGFQWRKVLSLDPTDAVRKGVDTRLKSGLEPQPARAVPAPARKS